MNDLIYGIKKFNMPYKPKGRQNHMIISKEAENSCNKNPTSLHVKVLDSLGRQVTYFNKIKAIYSKTIVNLKLSGEKFKAVPLKPKTRLGCVSLCNYVI